jgi:hypothetical protein
VYRALGYNQSTHSHPLPDPAGPDCVDSMTVALLAEGGLDEEPARRARGHVVDCARCFQLLDAAVAEVQHQRREVEAPEAVPVLVTARGGAMAWLERFLRPRVMGPVLGLLAAVALVVILPLGGPQPADLAGLAQIEPLPVRVTRDATSSGSVEAATAEGRAAYASGDYARAIAALAHAEDSPERDLYVASAHVLSGDRVSARPLLTEAMATGPGAVAHEARWLLAQVELLDGHRPEAILLLREVAAERGRRSAAAAALLSSLGDG